MHAACRKAHARESIKGRLTQTFAPRFVFHASAHARTPVYLWRAFVRCTWQSTLVCYDEGLIRNFLFHLLGIVCLKPLRKVGPRGALRAFLDPKDKLASSVCRGQRSEVANRSFNECGNHDHGRVKICGRHCTSPHITRTCRTEEADLGTGQR